VYSTYADCREILEDVRRVLSIRLPDEERYKALTDGFLSSRRMARSSGSLMSTLASFASLTASVAGGTGTIRTSSVSIITLLVQQLSTGECG